MRTAFIMAIMQKPKSKTWFLVQEKCEINKIIAPLLAFSLPKNLS